MIAGWRTHRRPVGSAREARWIVEHADGDGERALALADRRAAGEPLQYVLGRWPFRSLELDVDPRVLIPRPETEQVVEVALAELAGLVAGDRPPRPGSAPARCAWTSGPGRGPSPSRWPSRGRAGPGPGGLGHRRLVRRPGRGGAQPRRRWPGPTRRAADRVRLVEGRWFDALPPDAGRHGGPGGVQPPLRGRGRLPGLEPTVRDWEPRGALVARRTAAGWAAWPTSRPSSPARPGGCAPGGVLVVEIDPAQAGAAARHARRAGFAEAGAERDLAGQGPHGGGPAVTSEWSPWLADPEALALAAKALRAGAVVAVPTDTVYGLAVDPAQPKAVARLFALKERPAEVALPGAGGRTGAGREVAGPLGHRRRAPGRPVLARPARPWSSHGAGPSPPTSGGRPRPARRSGCGGRTIRWSGPCAASSGPLAVTSANRHGAAPATRAGRGGRGLRRPGRSWR